MNRGLIHIIFIIGFYLSPIKLAAQINNTIFEGSEGDGFDVSCFEQAATNAIFAGSEGDGFDAFCFEQMSTNAIFGGSTGDGYDAFCFEQNATNSIFAGSEGDGFDAFCFEQMSTNAIFGGSTGDGYDVFCFEQSATNSIFAGSEGDGFDAFCFEQLATNGIFGGSTGDGYDVLCFEQVATNNIFGGSEGDGYDQVCEIINPVVLPIELLLFDGELVEEDAILRWVVSAEIDNEYFVLERSLDAFDFEEVGLIASLGNTTNIREYRYIDEIGSLLGNPVVYYRLQQIDLDGSYEYSHIIALNLPMPQESSEYLLYPNPAREKVFIRNPNPITEEVQIVLYDHLGRLISHFNADALSLETGFAIPLEQLSAGSYHLRIIDGNRLDVKTFIKINP